MAWYDSHSINPEKGDFRVNDASPALQIGFKNFPMDEFGVTSEKMKKIAKHTVILALLTAQKDELGLTFNWYGSTLKNVETRGEQSAAGLAEISGVILVNVPENSAFAKSGLKVGDVILGCQDVKTHDFMQLLQVAKDFQYLTELTLVFQRNQTRQTVQFAIQ